MSKLHVEHPITALDTWSQVASVRTDGPARSGHDKATFLFTDIEGSTRRWEFDAAAMRDALEAHDLVLRGAIEANGGEVFACTGDGMCAAFAEPQDAVAAAAAAQRLLELPVRMGIGTGEADRRGGNYFGTVLNRTARVMAAGHGGQVLIDGATALLLSGVDLIALGPRRLRDISHPVDVFQLRAPGLRAGFPALRTADRTMSVVEPAPSTFIGRAADMSGLREAFRTHRLITLTGAGGVGKTRLAHEAAVHLWEDFADGALIVDLTAASDAVTVRRTVATTLGIACGPGDNLIDDIAAELQRASILLVLDNCDQGLDAAADLIEVILARTSTVKILATSREATLLPAEHSQPVKPLDIVSAAALFVEHAAAGGIAVSDDEVPAVVELCRRVGCLPREILLVTAQLASRRLVTRHRVGTSLNQCRSMRTARVPGGRRAVRWSVLAGFDGRAVNPLRRGGASGRRTRP